MAYTCPKCGRQYDPTLFEFGRTVDCECGFRLDIRDGHRQERTLSPAKSPPEEEPPKRRN